MTLEEQLRESLSEDKPTIEEGQNDTPEAGNQDLNPQEEEGRKAVYETDKRWGQYWKTPEDIYNSLVFEEKNNKPLITALQQRNIKDVNGLTQLLQKFDEYENPNSERNVVYDAMQKIYENPELSQKMTQFFQGLMEEQEQARFGAVLPLEVRQKLNKVDELEAREQQRAYEEEVSNLQKVVSDEVDKINKLCTQYGINPDISQYLDYFKNTGLSVKNIYDRFISMHLEDINKAVQERASSNTLKNVEETKKSSIVSSGEKKPSSDGGRIASVDDLRSKISETLAL